MGVGCECEIRMWRYTDIYSVPRQGAFCPFLCGVAPRCARSFALYLCILVASQPVNYNIPTAAGIVVRQEQSYARRLSISASPTNSAAGATAAGSTHTELQEVVLISTIALDSAPRAFHVLPILRNVVYSVCRPAS